MGKILGAFKKSEKKYLKNAEKAAIDIQEAMAAKDSQSLPMSSEFNQYQEIKTKLLTHYSKASIKTIMFTSTAHGDGSSFTATSFATTLVKDFKLNVLLMDANLRCPSLHETFNIENRQGLSDLLTQEEDKTFPVKRVGRNGLYLIPCGKSNSEITNLFESNRFEQTLKTMRKRFNYVILDVPPVNRYAESMVIGTKVDGVILVIKSDKTRQQVAMRAKQDLEEAGAKILGVILNRRKHYIPEWIYRRL
jgi:capsular exopolysaccharide synthesis family protein